MHYALQYPHLEFKTGRNLRMSPIYPKLRDAGAVFGQVMGYERPSWFQPDDDYSNYSHMNCNLLIILQNFTILYLAYCIFYIAIIKLSNYSIFFF